MKRVFAFGVMMVALVPAALRAQDMPVPPWEQVNAKANEARLPVTLDFSLPGEGEWLQKINADPALPSSRAEEALSATVRGTANELPATAAPAGPHTPYAYGATGPCGCGGGGCDQCASQGGRGGILGNLRGGTGPVREWLRNFCPDVYQKGTLSFEYGSQYWRSPIFVASANDTRMIPQVIRAGLMLNDPCPDRRLNGVFEVLAEADIIPIVQGAGSIIVGGSGLLRYHMVRNHRIVPYVQAGFGGTWTDSAGLAGSPTSTPFNFITQVGMGSHIFLNKKWAIVSESSYVWIGNWGIGTGAGYHVLGGLVGITRYFK